MAIKLGQPLWSNYHAAVEDVCWTWWQRSVNACRQMSNNGVLPMMSNNWKPLDGDKTTINYTLTSNDGLCSIS
jgi:hypothetical protein